MFSEEEAKKVNPLKIYDVLASHHPNTKDGAAWWLHFCLDKNLSIEKRKEIAFSLGKNANLDIDIVFKELNSYDREWVFLFEQLKDSFWSGVTKNEKVTDELLEKVYIHHGIKYLVDKENLPENIVKSMVNAHSYDLFNYYINSLSDKIKSALLKSDNKSIRERAEVLFKKSNFNPFFDNNKGTVNASDPITFGSSQKDQQKSVEVKNVSEKTTFNKIKDTVIEEIPDVTIRISAKQFVKLACVPIQGLCVRYDAHKANMFMHTQYGKSLISLISSESLRFIKLENKNHNNVKNMLAKELRIQAFAGVGNEILDTLRPIIFNAVKSVLGNSTVETTQPKINLLDDKISINANVTSETNIKNEVKI